VLDREGLVDRSNAADAGRVPWSEIRSIEVVAVRSERLLALHVADPEKYFEKGGPLRRLLGKLNHGSCGTPIAIPASALGVPIQDLERQVRDFHARYGGA
jgi:hypothetical protein